MMMMMMTSIQKERGTWHHTFQGLKKEFVSSWVVQHQYMYVHSGSFRGTTKGIKTKKYDKIMFGNQLI